jgi:predicted nucleic acid-binding protein
LPSYFFDTSALVKLYHSEPGAKYVEEIFHRQENTILIASLTVVETESALSKKVRTEAISIEQRRQAAGRFYLDLATRIKVVAMHDIHFSLAGKLIRHYGFHQALLALDALQLAVASELRRMGLVDWVVSADATLLSVAKAEDLPIINPLTL